MFKKIRNQKLKIPLSLKLKPLLYCTLGHIFPRTTAKSALKVWKKPLNFQMPQREMPYAHKAEKSFLKILDHQIRVWRWGQGPTILFIHGWGGRGTQISCWVDELVASGFQVVAFDMPAHGESSGTQTTPFIQQEVLKMVLSKIDDLHTVITHSWGGLLFSSVYEDAMQNKHLIMLCPPSSFQTPLNHFKKMLKVPNRVQKRIIESMNEQFGKSSIDALSTTKHVHNMNYPVLVIHDKNDKVVPFSDGIDVALSAPHGYFYGTFAFGHVNLLYEACILNIIKDFIK